ncbi:endonuclease III domain-containing protein [Hydrogenimonas sp.]
MKKSQFTRMVDRLEAEYAAWDAPAKRFEAAYRRTPFTILVSVMLSFRTKDEVTLEAGKRLFALADTPETMAALTEERIAEAIYPVGFYRKKAQTIRQMSRYLLEHCGGEVPRNEAELLKIKGVGPKAAHIVLETAFGEKTVAVDTHVHRILNLWGFLATATPEESFNELKRRLSPEEQAGLNKLLVSFGQVICRPAKPLCTECPVADECPAFTPDSPGSSRRRV